MSSERERVRLVGALTLHIDNQQPPCVGACRLAQAIVELVEDRNALEALEMSGAIAALARRFPRKPVGSTR
jgi:hypothetical protein